MNALEMLLQRIRAPGALAPAGSDGLTRISAGQGLLQPQGMPSPEMLAALAARQRNWEAQQDSPAYDEGEIMAPEPWWNEALGPEKHLFDEAQRNERLVRDLGDVGDVATSSTQAVPEGSYLSSRPVGMSPFASPLNQLMQLGRRAPLSMY